MFPLFYFGDYFMLLNQRTVIYILELQVNI